MLWPITLLLGLFFIFLIGYLLQVKFRLKADIFLFSFGLGSAFVIFLLFSLNQYFRIPMSSAFIWITTLITTLLLILLHHRHLIKKLSSLDLNLGFKFTTFSVLILILFLIASYKAIFFPIISDDAISMYAFISREVWNNGFPPTPSSAFMELSYAWPNTNFALFLYNYFFGLNFSFDDIFIRVLVPLFALLNLLVLYRLTLLLFKKKEIAQLAVAILLSTIIFSAFIVQEQTTMYELFFPLLAIYVFALYQKEKDYRLLILTGIFLAATLMIKYTLIPFVLFFIFSVFLVKKNIKPALKLALIAFPLSLVFYLRNLIFLRNPFFPYFFGGTNYDDKLFQLQNKLMNVPSYTL
mgnify:FL=1